MQRGYPLFEKLWDICVKFLKLELDKTNFNDILIDMDKTEHFFNAVNNAWYWRWR